MRKLLALLFVAALAIGGGVAIAQVYPPAQVQQMFGTDLFQDNQQGGAPQSQNVYATGLQLQSWIFGSALGHSAKPVVSTCGTTAISNVGTDYAGTVTVGSSATTACTLTFAVAYNKVPSCVVTSQSQLTSFAYAVAAGTIIITQTSTASNLWNYVCVAQAGG